MRRIERLINLIAALLDGGHPMTAAEIRERIAGYESDTPEAFRRSFERDKAELREMGIPIEVTKDEEDNDAYLIPPQKYYMPDLDLKPDELAALRLVADAVLGVGEQAETGLRKLSVTAGDQAMGSPQVVWGADVAAEQPNLGPLLSGLLDKQPLLFDYVASDGNKTSRHVEPYSLAHRRGNWYLVARDVERDALRSFKVSRVVPPIRRGTGTYEIPSDLDLDSQLGAEPWEIGEGDHLTARVRFDRALRWWPEQNLTNLSSKEGPEGSVEVEMQVARLDALIQWVLAFGPSVEIIEPEEARAAMVEHVSVFAEGAS